MKLKIHDNSRPRFESSCKKNDSSCDSYDSSCNCLKHHEELGCGCHQICTPCTASTIEGNKSSPKDAPPCGRAYLRSNNTSACATQSTCGYSLTIARASPSPELLTGAALHQAVLQVRHISTLPLGPAQQRTSGRHPGRERKTAAGRCCDSRCCGAAEARKFPRTGPRTPSGPSYDLSPSRCPCSEVSSLLPRPAGCTHHRS